MMETSITKFRRDIFEMANRAMAGAEVWVVHKGRRFRLVPEEGPGSRLGRITPLEVVNPDSPDMNDAQLREEMARAWEKDWATL